MYNNYFRNILLDRFFILGTVEISSLFTNLKIPIMYSKYSIAIFSFLFLLISCKNKNTPKTKDSNSTTIKYARGFDIIKENSKEYLLIKKTFGQKSQPVKYLLVNHSTKQQNTLKVPIEKLVITSTTHVPMVELLGRENTIIGFPNTKYISSKKTRNLVDSGAIKELGEQQSMNTETLIELSPELIVGFSLGSNNNTYSLIKKLGIPVIYNSDWLEETPLGRAEWIKFFGVLLGRSKEADSIFSVIENNYIETKKLAKTKKNKTTVISGNMFKDIWYVPAGESFMAKYLSDANLDYLWKNSKGTGSLQLNFESVLDQGQHADYWLGCGASQSRKDLIHSNKHYTKFDAFKNHKIYTVANKKGASGGLIYFELAPTRPDLVLKDLIKITQPNLLPDYDCVFFEKLK